MTGAPETAMVLAAGLGTRMRPLTDDTPKPLINVAGKALIDYALDRFADAGVAHAVVNVHHFADQLEAHLRSRANPQIIISDERALLLETGGGLKKARSHFGSAPIYCTNTDAIMIDKNGEACAALSEQWDNTAMDALLLLAPVEAASGYGGKGDFDRSEDGRIAFRSADAAPYVFTGLQIIAPALIDEGPVGAFSTKLLWERAAARGRLFGAVYSGFWMHVGDPEGLAAAERMLARETP
jgi:MurNAc alpha-1-phosphate uridylyltransferase